MQYLYSLEKGSKKHRCPRCNKKTFVRYVNNDTGEYLPAEVGRCDREQKCGYHAKPEKPKRATHDIAPQPIRISPPKQRETAYLPEFILNRTQNSHAENVFLNNLKNNIPAVEVDAVRKLYSVGTISRGYKAGAVSFPYIDTKGRINAIQVKQFDQSNHTTATDFLHSMIERHFKRQNKPLPDWLKKYIDQDRRVNCLFGAHLLPEYPNNPVALVEAPKTAMIGTLYFGSPAESESNLIWLATYNKSSFKKYKCDVLTGRHVAIFPDLGAFNDWSEKAADILTELSGVTFTVSDLLETSATETDKKNGLDLADYLTKYDWEQFRGKSDKSDESDTSKKTFKNTIEEKKDNNKTHPADLLSPCDSFTPTAAALVLMRHGYNENAAAKAIDVMIQRKELLPIPSGGYYYLSGSTPF